MENNQNKDNLKYELLKLHYKYLIAIAAILFFGSIVLATFNQNNFVSQVSFAGTITSIILSVIAIWMSISNERTTNDLRMKIAESTERLSGTTKEIEILNNNHKETMDKQLDELKSVQEQLTQVIHSINNVEKQVSYIYENKSANFHTIDNNTMKTDQKFNLFNNVFLWATNNDYIEQYIFYRITQIIIDKKKVNSPFSLDEIMHSLTQSGINVNCYLGAIHVYWGIINTLLAASVFDDDEITKHISEGISNKFRL